MSDVCICMYMYDAHDISVCCVCVYMMCMFIYENSSHTHALVSVWRSEDNPSCWVLPFILFEIGSLACHCICQHGGTGNSCRFSCL